MRHVIIPSGRTTSEPCQIIAIVDDVSETSGRTAEMCAAVYSGRMAAFKPESE